MWYKRSGPFGVFQTPGAFPPAFFISRGAELRELSVFVDESGADGLDSDYYLLTLVFHDQSVSLADGVSRYEQSLAARGLPNLPFHASPLMNGHDDYSFMSVENRLRLLAAFRVLFRYLPIRYKTFSYRKREFANAEHLSERMRRDVVNFLFDNLDYLQQFDRVKVYYDGGQHAVTQAIHDALEYALVREAVVYRAATPSEYRLSQAADYACAVELTALKYQAHEETATDRRFFGSWGTFRRNVLKTVRKKAFVSE